MTDFAATAEAIAKQAKTAARVMAQLSADVKTQALERMAAALADGADAIRTANAQDVAAAQTAGLSPAPSYCSSWCSVSLVLLRPPDAAQKSG